MPLYIGRFAPSPTGPLHLGSLACLLASFLDARAHQGKWLVRIENIDPPREPKGTVELHLQTIERLGLSSDGPILYQSERSPIYEKTLQELKRKGFVYGCACTRKEIEERGAFLGLPHGVYPQTCRNGTGSRPERAQRFRIPEDSDVTFTDRIFGSYSQNVAREVGDFVLKRADGLWAYQLAVTVDDAAQGITHIVRGADLLDNTPRQILLQKAVGAPTVQYLHIPVVKNEFGQKLSKQAGAKALDLDNIEKEVQLAWKHLGFEDFEWLSLKEFYEEAVHRWAARFV